VISRTYEAENYGAAILDAMHHLSNILRAKANVDGDGPALVGQALGGESPRLRVNRLQTITEKDVQKGLEQILRGLYLGIRNPRSHEHVEDSAKDADALIHFVSYVLDIIDQTEEPFTITRFLGEVFDPDFYLSPKHAKLLVGEIPGNKRLDTLVEVFRHRMDGPTENARYIVAALVDELADEQLAQFVLVVSDELKTPGEDTRFRTALQVLPPHLWPRMSEVSRLRAENKLIQSIREGEEYEHLDNTKGALGTRARDFLPHFLLKADAMRVLTLKLEDTDADDRRYVASYFMSVLPQAITDKPSTRRCIAAMAAAVRGGDKAVTDSLVRRVCNFPTEWRTMLVEELRDLTNPDYPLLYLPDGTPFLTDSRFSEPSFAEIELGEPPPDEGDDFPF
jgi:uncharacterized protein (TIGR02391 family)